VIARSVALLALAAAAVGCASAARGRFEERGFLFRELSVGGRVYPYAVYVPRAYDPARPWPVVLFLHGRGESGTDGVKPIIQGIGSAILWNSERWPALVVFPQKPGEDSEWEQHEAAVLAILDTVRREYRVDDDRIYLTGLSQGGHGTWVLGARHPGTWAALVSVCAYAAAHPRAAKLGLPPASFGAAEQLAAGIGDLPFWLFHGDADDVVPAEQTREMARALAALGHPPKATIYPGVNHNSWDRAYAEEELPRWLFAQRRSPSRMQ
jgi:predicted peptidase